MRSAARGIPVARFCETRLNEFRARYSLVGFQVFLPCLGDNVARQRRRGAVFVPTGRLQPVPDELLVVGWRIAPRFVLIDGPETRAVGREDFVDEDQLAAREPAPFELGVGDDDAFAT